MCTATPPQVFALIRYSDDPQRFSIEYSNGQVRRYAATERYVPMPAELCISGAELLIMSADYSGLSAGYSSLSTWLLQFVSWLLRCVSWLFQCVS